MSAKIDTADYSMTFIGILNEGGQFWTPLIFEGESRARDHVEAFWGGDKQTAKRCLEKFSFVPVRAVVEVASPSITSEGRG